MSELSERIGMAKAGLTAARRFCRRSAPREA